MAREITGVDCFHKFCENRGRTFSSIQDLTIWWRRHVVSARNQLTDRLAELIRHGLIVIHYESGTLTSDENRSREYAAMLLHRDHFMLFKEFCKDDQRFIYLFTDADREKTICESENGVVNVKKRQPLLVTCDVGAKYYHYAMVWWPLATMFRLQSDVANHLMNNYVLAQICEREVTPTSRILTFLECFVARMHEVRTENFLGTHAVTTCAGQIGPESPAENVADLGSQRVDASRAPVDERH